MPTAWKFRLAMLIGLTATAAMAQPVESDAPQVRLLVPAYFYPAGDGLAAWKKLLESAEKTPVVAIVNPDSGPGKRADQNYRDVFRHAGNSKITLIGYVTLSYAQRPLSAVKADIDSWLHFYPDVRGIFFDEQPSQAEHVAYAAECFAYARQRLGGGTFITNPGVICAREYLAGRDAPVACLFEHELGFDKYLLPEWAAHMGRDKFVVLLYGVQTPDQMRKSFASARERRAGHVYITDRPAPMPWDRLPAYWEDEVAAAVQANARFVSGGRVP